MLVMAFILGLVIGGGIVFIISGVVLNPIALTKTDGCIHIDQSDPNDNPYLFLELKREPMYLCNKKYTVFKVDIKNYISSQK